MEADHAQSNPPRPQRPRERFWPLLFRRLSLTQYRASERFGRHRGKVGPERVLPAPPLVDTLTVYFLDALPPRVVARIGVDGCRRRARIVCGVLATGRAILRPAWWLARGSYRLLTGRRSRPTAGTSHRRSPAGNIQITLAERVQLCGYAFGDDRLTLYWQRLARVPHPAQIFVHVYAKDAAGPNAEAPSLRISKDHDPDCPLPDWPRGRVYEDRIDLTDLSAGDYRIEVGLIDLVRLERFEIAETGRTTVDLGWFRIAGDAPDTVPARAPTAEVAIASR